MKIEQFRTQRQSLRQRVQLLYRRAHEPTQQQIVLPQALEELDAALDMLQSVEQVLQQQHDRLLDKDAALEADVQRYKDLFTNAPIAYIVTNLDGTIRQANVAAETLLQTPERLLVGRSFANFTPEGQRRSFRADVTRMSKDERTQTIQLMLHPAEGTPFDATLTVAVARGRRGHPIALRWLIQPTHDLQSAAQLRTRCDELAQQVQTLEATLRETAVQSKHHDSREQSTSSTKHDGQLSSTVNDAQQTILVASNSNPRRPNTESRQRYQFLSRVIRLLVAPLDDETLLSHISRLAVPAFADLCILDHYTSDDECIRCIAAIEHNAEQTVRVRQLGGRYFLGQYAEQSIVRMLQTGQPQIATDGADVLLRALALNPEQRAIFNMFTPNMCMIVPICHQDTTIGACTFVTIGQRALYQSDDLALAEEVATCIASALNNVRLLGPGITGKSFAITTEL